MSTRVRLIWVGALVCCALVAPAVVATASGPPIRPAQFFVGLVNGSHQNVTVRTVCPGPAATGSGSVAGGQTMAVARAMKAIGNTGVLSGVYAWFVPKAPIPRPASLHFRTYDTRLPIPASFRVPCDGVGVVQFSSCPYLAPCAYGWVPSYVHVRLVNIGA